MESDSFRSEEVYPEHLLHKKIVRKGKRKRKGIVGLRKILDTVNSPFSTRRPGGVHYCIETKHDHVLRTGFSKKTRKKS